MTHRTKQFIELIYIECKLSNIQLAFKKMIQTIYIAILNDSIIGMKSASQIVI